MLTGAYVKLPDLLNFSSSPPPKRDKKRGFGIFAGERRARNRGRGIDFEEVRLYQPGDDVRNIDWNVTARKQVPHTKVFREERERPTFLIVDQSSTMFFGSRKRLKSVAAAEIAARLAWFTLANQDRIGGVVLGDGEFVCIKPRRSSKNVARLLLEVVDRNQSLQTMDGKVSGNSSQSDIWDSLLAQLQRITPANNRIVLVSDLMTIKRVDFQRFLGRSRHNELEVIHVYDPLERELPPPDIYAVTDGDGFLEFDSATQSNRKKYTDRFDARRAWCNDRCLEHAVSFFSISTDEEVSSNLVHG